LDFLNFEFVSDFVLRILSKNKVLNMQIPLPPLPDFASSYGWLIGAGGLLAGAMLLLWGSKLSRLITALGGAGGGSNQPSRANVRGHPP